MTIHTELNIADDAYFMMGNKVYQSTIEGITIDVDAMGYYRSKYCVVKNPAGSQYTRWFNENEIFGTKEKLLATL
jgi:hypothetical protein